MIVDSVHSSLILQAFSNAGNQKIIRHMFGSKSQEKGEILHIVTIRYVRTLT